MPNGSDDKWSQYKVKGDEAPKNTSATTGADKWSQYKVAAPAESAAATPSTPSKPAPSMSASEMYDEMKKRLPIGHNLEKLAPVLGAGAGAGMATSVLGKMLGSGVGAALGSAGEDVSGGKSPDVSKALKEGAGYAAFEGLGAAAGKAIGKLTSQADVLARINKILGVGTKEVRVGTTPETLDAFAANPARGVVKSGISEKALSKMDPLARNKVITEAREVAGQKLDATLKAASDAGKTVNVHKVVMDTLSDIPDRRLQKQATTRLGLILKKNGLTMPQLDKLTPTQARAVQRSLDDFANFSAGGEVKSFKDIATRLRRGISAQTRIAVPESVPLDQHYGDLAGATSATRKAAAKFATKAPESELRKWAKRAGAGILGGGALYEGYKLFSGEK